MRLDADQLEALAELVAARLQPPTRDGLVGVRAVADYLGCDASWVYEHAAELGVRRLGSGPKAPLRFSLAEVDERLRSCSTGRGSPTIAAGVGEPVSRRRPTGRSGTGVALLPVRGRP